MKKIITIAVLFLSVSVFGDHSLKAQLSITEDSLVHPRMRVIVDNDFGGDPDGLFQLAHLLLSPSVKIEAIIGSRFPAINPADSLITATRSLQKAKDLLQVMGLSNAYQVIQGCNLPLRSTSESGNSEAARMIVKEAMRTDTKMPLYILCGGGLTDIADAFLLNPQIKNKITLVWIGGSEYEGIALPPPDYSNVEYNLGIDIKAAEVIFNNSDIKLWQIPRNAYREVLFPYSCLKNEVEPQGRTGKFLSDQLKGWMRLADKFGIPLGETYILGDSPLVLLTALQSSFQPDPSSSFYTIRQCPLITAQGTYAYNPEGRFIRVYGNLDVPLLLNDFIAKLKLFHAAQQK